MKLSRSTWTSFWYRINWNIRVVVWYNLTNVFDWPCSNLVRLYKKKETKGPYKFNLIVMDSVRTYRTVQIWTVKQHKSSAEMSLIDLNYWFYFILLLIICLIIKDDVFWLFFSHERVLIVIRYGCFGLPNVFNLEARKA